MVFQGISNLPCDTQEDYLKFLLKFYLFKHLHAKWTKNRDDGVLVYKIQGAETSCVFVCTKSVRVKFTEPKACIVGI